MSPEPSAPEGQRTDTAAGEPGTASPLASVPAPAASSENAPPPADEDTPGGVSRYLPGRREALWLAGGALFGVAVGAGGVAVSKRGSGAVTRGEEKLDAKQALEELTAGNDRWVAGKPVHPDQSLDRREAAAGGQAPFAAVLSCADSRVAPETIFDQGVGDLYTVRSLAQVTDEAVIGSLEYSIENLGVPLIVVLGHTQCGAVKAAVDAVEKEKAAESKNSSSDESSSDSSDSSDSSGGTDAEADHAIFRPVSDEHSAEKDDTTDDDPASEESVESSIDGIVEAIRPAVEEAEDLGAEGSKLLSVAVDMNVDRVVEELKQSPIISKALKLRTVKIVGGTYGLRSGEVNWA